MNATQTAMRLVREQWDRNAPVVSINRAHDYRRQRQRDQWLQANTRPMPPTPPRAA